MKTKEAILLYKEDLHRTGYSRFRFLYDPLVSLLLFFRLSDCNNCFLQRKLIIVYILIFEIHKEVTLIDKKAMTLQRLVR